MAKKVKYRGLSVCKKEEELCFPIAFLADEIADKKLMIDLASGWNFATRNQIKNALNQTARKNKWYAEGANLIETGIGKNERCITLNVFRKICEERKGETLVHRNSGIVFDLSTEKTVERLKHLWDEEVIRDVEYWKGHHNSPITKRLREQKNPEPRKLPKLAMKLRAFYQHQLGMLTRSIEANEDDFAKSKSPIAIDHSIAQASINNFMMGIGYINEELIERDFDTYYKGKRPIKL